MDATRFGDVVTKHRTEYTRRAESCAGENRDNVRNERVVCAWHIVLLTERDRVPGAQKRTG